MAKKGVCTNTGRTHIKKGEHISVKTEFKKGSIPWNKGKTKKDDPRIPQPLLGKHRSDETKEKIKKSHTGMKKPWSSEYRKKCVGEKHPLWIKDRSKLKKDSREPFDGQYKCWSMAVKMRDNWKCKIKSDECKGRLEAHHIYSWKDFSEKRYDINNGITLCVFHHPRNRKEEVRLREFFIKVLEGGK